MAVNLVVGVTDGDWFRFLRSRPYLDEVNFWSPGRAPFKALSPGELFLFKLHAPHNYIVGGGVFVKATEMHCSLAWEAFEYSNGADSFRDMRARIARYRRADVRSYEDFVIGCRILTQPFFLEEIEWIPVPRSWSPQIVSYKRYSTEDTEGMALWQAVQDRFHLAPTPALHEGERYGNPMLVRPRLGQGAFRVVVTDNYGRRCAITGERTLPALEAAHIKPYAEGGTHDPSNGLLFRRDLHSLFDRGYVTVTPDLHFEVSNKIREEFENGRDYYRLHGSAVTTPEDIAAKPDIVALQWHNEHRFQG